MTRIHVTVPMRIDFAGGTLDVYPLYLFEGGGLTVNAAINVMAQATIETRDDPVIHIHSLDLGFSETIHSIQELVYGGHLDLVKRALGYFHPGQGLDISISSEAPSGSGLGASSALLMALAHGLNVLTGRNLSSAQIIDIGANIEAQVIGIPTGKQDYFPPIYGGVCSMWFDVDGWRYEKLNHSPALIEGLNERLVVSYCGVPHDSAVTNWAMLKSYIENQGSTVACMGEIRRIANEMRACLVASDFTTFAALLNDEWQLRRSLAEGVTNPEIERIMQAARDAGAKASKICGAGGGGCMVTTAEPQDIPAVKAAIRSAGASVMPAAVIDQGVEIILD